MPPARKVVSGPLVRAPSAPMPAPDAMQRVEERLALHELVRVGLARQEDLRTLQAVAFPDGASFSSASRAAQVVRECALREEWRYGREEHLLGKIVDSSLLSCGTGSGVEAGPGLSGQRGSGGLDAEEDRKHTQQLADQLAALQQIEEEQRSMRLRRAGSRSRVGVGGANQQRKSSAFGGGVLSSGQPVPLLPPRTPQIGQQRSARAPGTAAGKLRPTRVSMPSPYSSANPCSSSNVQSVPRPISAPNSTRPSPPSGSGPSPVLRSQASFAPKPQGNRTAQGANGRPMGKSANSLGGALPACAREDGASVPAGGNARFQQLYRLHGTLLRNLEGHKAASGTGVATSALETNVREAQTVFARCWHEAQELVAELVASEQQMLQQENSGSRIAWGEVSRPGTRGGPGGKGLSWDRLLRLGELGLTAADVKRLEQLRRSGAARVIQRAARAWLRIVRHRRAIVAAQKRAEEMRRRLLRSAATIIQKWWRGILARRRVKRLRAEHLEQKRRERVARLRRTLAAIRIQRFFRSWLKRRRARRAIMGLPPDEKRGPAPTGTSARVSSKTASAAAAKPASSLTSAAGPSTSGASAAETTTAGGRSSHPAGPRSQYGTQHQRSATIIQACVRGWLIRRSQQLWWVRSLAGLRGRRAAAASWALHQKRMVRTFGMQHQMVEAVAREAELCRAAVHDARREHVEFEEAWDRWLAHQLELAMAQPLPKGWVAQASAAGPAFLNTRTGEIHAFHPAVQQLRGHVHEQREAAEQQFSGRERRVAEYLDQLHLACLKNQAEILRRMTVER